MEATDFEIVPAPEATRPFVRRFMYANRRLDAPFVMRPKPTGYIYFSNAFNSSQSGPNWQAMIDGEQHPSQSRWNIAGQIVDHDIAVHVTDQLQVIFCELSATATHRLFGLPGITMTGKVLPLFTAGADFETLARRCFVSGPENTRDGHMAEATAFFEALIARAAPGDPAVEKAVEMLEAVNGAIKVTDICKEVGVGQRHLSRRFTSIVGVNPKFFGQILQINWVVGLLYFNDTATLTEIAHDAGFYDQPHFNHAMQRFFSEGPSEFLKSDHVAFKTFLGASRRFGPEASP